jgi:acetyltransferase-like isoleucine patch superfamily enzyme
MKFWHTLQKLFKPAKTDKRKDPSETRVWHEGRSSVTMGRFTYSGSISIRQWGEGANLTIGQFCSLADGLTIFLGGNHRVDWATTFPFGHVFASYIGRTAILGHPSTKGDVEIGNDVWLGSGTTILSGVVIGDGAVVAAGSMITKSIGAYEIWGGNPARKIKDRFPREVSDGLLALQWWNLPIKTVSDLAPILSQPPTVEIIEEAARLARGRS